MSRLEVRRPALRHNLVRQPAPAWRAGLTWPRLPAAAEVAMIGAGYLGYALVRLAVRAGRHAAFAHAAELWRAERWLHLDVELSLNHLASAGPALAEATGYYYGLLHFIVTPLVLGWLYLRRPSAFPRLRSALVLATSAANIVFWTWPVAPPRYSVPGMTDILVSHHVLGAADPHGPGRLVNLYAAMPSLHVAWATWCAVAVITATRSRWRHLAWLYPWATVLVVLASANHFLLDVAGGLAVLGLGLLGTAGKQRRPCDRHRGAAARQDPAGRGAPPTSTVTITVRPAAGAVPAGAPCTAFVLAGGAALGAMQAGMVCALHERGITPDLLARTSAGTLNAAFPASRPPTVATAEHWRPSGAGCGAATSSRSACAWSGSGDYASRISAKP